MSEFTGFDLDRSTARAWSKFQARLADHVAEMEDDDILLVEAESSDDEDEADGCAPYVQFCAYGEDRVRCEVASNEYLAVEHLLDASGVEALHRLGWSTPTCDGDDEDPGQGSANFYLDLERSHADRVAVMTVQTFRDVFGVQHPAFLVAGGLGLDPDDPDLGVPMAAGAMSPPADEQLAVTPDSSEHLRDLVDAALTPLFGQLPEKDDDGDIPVPCGSSLVYVRVNDEAPVVELFGIVADDVTDLERAAFEVAVLNRDVRFIKFILVKNRVLALVQLSALPFAPEHLRSILTGMSEKLDAIDEDLVARIGGRRALGDPAEPADPADPADPAEPADPADPADPAEPEGEMSVSRSPVSLPQDAKASPEKAMLTLLQLDVHGVGDVDPELAAGVCDFDRDLILGLITNAEEQEISWRGSRDKALSDGDGEEAAACDHELRAWQSTTVVLRSALRLVVERSLGRDPAEGASYSPPRGVRAARTRRDPLPSHPPRPRKVRNVEDLLRMYTVDDLYELDSHLLGEHGLPFEVFELGAGVEVHLEDWVVDLEYPFTLADFHDLFEVLVKAQGMQASEAGE